MLLQIKMPFPGSGQLVYDFRLDDGGISKTTAEDDDEDDKKKINVRDLPENSTTIFESKFCLALPAIAYTIFFSKDMVKVHDMVMIITAKCEKTRLPEMTGWNLGGGGCNPHCMKPRLAIPSDSSPPSDTVGM